MRTTKLTGADLRLIAEWLVYDYERAEAAGLVRSEPQRRSLVRLDDGPATFMPPQKKKGPTNAGPQVALEPNLPLRLLVDAGPVSRCQYGGRGAGSAIRMGDPGDARAAPRR